MIFPRGPADIFRTLDPRLDFFVDLVLAPITIFRLDMKTKIIVVLTLSILSRWLRCDIMCTDRMKEVRILAEAITIIRNLCSNLGVLLVLVVPVFGTVARLGALETA